MKYAVPFLCFVSVIALGACGQRVSLSPQRKAALESVANARLTCMEGSDCKQKWGRAIEWVRRTSPYDIAFLNSHMIKTRGRSYYAQGMSHPAFMIMKYASGGGRYAIDYYSFCDAVFDDCLPSGLEIRANFKEFVSGRTDRLLKVSLP